MIFDLFGNHSSQVKKQSTEVASILGIELVFDVNYYTREDGTIFI